MKHIGDLPNEVQTLAHERAEARAQTRGKRRAQTGGTRPGVSRSYSKPGPPAPVVVIVLYGVDEHLALGGFGT